MDWSYVAGYFDGEGHVGLHRRGKVEGGVRCLSWYNTHLGSLEAIKAFMGCGNVRQTKQESHQNKPGYTLGVSNRRDILMVLGFMMPHLIIKREAAERLAKHLAIHTREVSPNFGKLAAMSDDELRRLYCDRRLSVGQIARQVGVSHSAVCNRLKRADVERRPFDGSHMKGVPKSEETRRRMKESRRRMWADPEFRAKHSKILSANMIKYQAARKLAAKGQANNHNA
jgi:transposase-like protein